MNTSKKLSQLLNNSKELVIDDNSKIIIMSDCHRGYDTWGDDFSRNENIFLAALSYYYTNSYTYVEVGDGDDLWENKSLSKIIETHKDVFSLLYMFDRMNRLYLLFGNHDIVKKKECINHSLVYNNGNIERYMLLFKDICVDEALVLRYLPTNDRILITHGHQGDFLNDRIWKVSRFLVRYLWHPLELIGIKNPTSAASSINKKLSVEGKLKEWTDKNKQMLIAGHTHRPVFPKVGEPLYFNDGCCVHPRYVTGIEIADGDISLIKWSIKTRMDQSLFVAKEALFGPIKLKDYFDNL